MGLNQHIKRLLDLADLAHDPAEALPDNVGDPEQERREDQHDAHDENPARDLVFGLTGPRGSHELPDQEGHDRRCGEEEPHHKGDLYERLVVEAELQSSLTHLRILHVCLVNVHRAH